MIQASQIQVTCNSTPLLKNLNFQAAPGELVALVGANGAGKSTLLKVLTGLMAASRGQVILSDKLLTDYSSQERAKYLGYLSQQSSVSADLTAQEIVMLGRYPYQRSCSNTENQHAVQHALTLVAMNAFAQRRYQTLSGGEQQKVHLARVLAQINLPAATPPRFLLLDEHAAHLDLAHQHHTFQLLRSLLPQSVGIISVVHDLNLALAYADRVVVLHKGSIIATGTPSTVLTPEIIQHAFDWQTEKLYHQGHSWILPKIAH